MNPAPPHDWHFVYLLRSVKSGASYIGCTQNINNRLKEHLSGNVYTTKRMLPIELIYYEAFNSKKLAYDRERKLKHHGSVLIDLKKRTGGAG